ncbi:MAG: HAD family hydrolase [Candidatus Hodarchaeales archaeon]|jgi:HAD superfamily hydrolase (TIGR01549 family)
MSKVQALIFDFGGTLFDYNPPNAVVWVNVAKKFGKEIRPNDPILINAMILQEEEFEKLFIKEDKTVYLSKTDWIRLNSTTLLTLGITDPSAAVTVERAFEERFGQYKIFPDTIHTLRELKEKGIRLGLVSNVVPELVISRRNMLHKQGILDAFDTIILSSEVGVSKPDKRIFELALKELNIDDPATVLHVGDSIVTDVRGARNTGIIPVLFDTTGLRNVDCLQIISLSDIIDLI